MRSLRSLVPELSFCALSLIALPLGGCTYKLGEPIRIYDSRDEAAPKPTPAAVPAGAAHTSSPSDHSTPKAKPCVAQGELIPNAGNFPEREAFNQKVTEVEKKYGEDRHALRKDIVAYAEATLGIKDPDELRKFVGGIMALSKSQAPVPATPAPSASPAPVSEPATTSLHASVKAWVVHQATISFGTDHEGMNQGLADSKAMADKVFLRPDGGDLLLAFQKALGFANDKQNGLGLDHAEAVKFATSIAKSPNPPQTLVNFIEIFKNELDLRSTVADARETAAKQTCLLGTTVAR